MKGRDWYDLVWYAANHPQLHLRHLEQRMIQSGHLKKKQHLTGEKLSAIAEAAVERLDVDQARREVGPFVKDPEALAIWSRDFFCDVIRRIIIV